MAKTLEMVDLEAAVAAEDTEIDSVIRLLGNLAAQIEAVAGNSGATKALAADVRARTGALAAAVVANTPSAGQSPVPGAPSGVAASSIAGGVSLTWPGQADATSFNLYTGSATGVTPASGTKTTGATSPNVQLVTTGTAVFAVVTANNAAGESLPSAEVNATAT